MPILKFPPGIYSTSCSRLCVREAPRSTCKAFVHVPCAQGMRLHSAQVSSQIEGTNIANEVALRKENLRSKLGLPRHTRAFGAQLARRNQQHRNNTRFVPFLHHSLTDMWVLANIRSETPHHLVRSNHALAHPQERCACIFQAK